MIKSNKESLCTNNLSEYVQAMKLSQRGKIPSVTPVYHKRSSTLTRLPDDNIFKEKIFLSIINDNRVDTDEKKNNGDEGPLAFITKHHIISSQFLPPSLPSLRNQESTLLINCNTKTIDKYDLTYGNKISKFTDQMVNSKDHFNAFTGVSNEGGGDNSNVQPHYLKKKLYKLLQNHKEKHKIRSSDSIRVTTDHCQHVFAINGSAMAFKQFGCKNFTNWFGDEGTLNLDQIMLNDFKHEVDLSGFTNQEITMKLYDGNKFIIEAARPCRGKYTPKTIKRKIILPNWLSIDSLYLSRNNTGHLIIRKMISPHVQKETLTCSNL